MSITEGQIDLELLQRTTDEMFSLDQLRNRLSQPKPLRIKYGVDVTAPFLHIGHAVNLWMMRHFQEQGHKVIFLIGDFTTRIGDPTGKSKTRQIISPQEIEKNAQAFIDQVGMVLKTDDEVFEIRRNSEWFDKMPAGEFMSLLSMVTHQRLIQRDMFQRRIENKQEIFVHEMIYPIIQGYDSVMLESDLTIVGSDQLFNEMMGRAYQDRFGQPSQIVITTKITPGIDGKEKQSKSLGNYIAIIDSARDKFGKIMSIPDDLIVPYLNVYTEMSKEQVASVSEGLTRGVYHPMLAKKQLAMALVERYHGREVAVKECEWFENAFSQRNVPVDIPEVVVSSQMDIVSVICRCDDTLSRSQARRLLAQGAVRINGNKADQDEENICLHDGDLIQIGKRRWFRMIACDDTNG